jgi:transposase
VPIIDNLGSHKINPVRAAIKTADARLLFLPSYSSDLNPIEQVFPKLKQMLRKAKEKTIEATWHQNGSIVIAFKSEERANYARNSDYGST